MEQDGLQDFTFAFKNGLQTYNMQNAPLVQIQNANERPTHEAHIIRLSADQNEHAQSTIARDQTTKQRSLPRCSS